MSNVDPNKIDWIRKVANNKVLQQLSFDIDQISERQHECLIELNRARTNEEYIRVEKKLDSLKKQKDSLETEYIKELDKK